MLISINVDEENSAEEWWAHAQNSDDAPNVGGVDEDGRQRVFSAWLSSSARTLVLAEEDADRVLEWAAALPGWEDGPEWAPTPLVTEEGEVVGHSEVAGQQAVHLGWAAWTVWRGGHSPAAAGEVFRSDDNGDLVVRDGIWVPVDPDDPDAARVAEMFG